jgi:hypothetical protein
MDSLQAWKTLSISYQHSTERISQSSTWIYQIFQHLIPDSPFLQTLQKTHKTVKILTLHKVILGCKQKAFEKQVRKMQS